MDRPAAPPASRMAVALFALLGLVIAGYMLAYTTGLISTIACGSSGGCSRVQSSPWATFLGIPVPLWGVLGYGATFALAMLALQPAFAESRRIALALLAAGTIGFGFSVYLSAVEQFLIGAWCRWCIGSAVVATLMFVATLFEIPRIRRTA